MTFADPNSRVERARLLISRAVLVASIGLLVVGVVLAEASHVASLPVLEVACALLLAVPVLNAIAALLEEIGRRDWPFVGAVLLVLALVAYSVVERLN